MRKGMPKGCHHNGAGGEMTGKLKSGRMVVEGSYAEDGC